MKPSIEIELFGLRLRSPLIVASSGLTANLDRMRRAEDNGAGAVVMKGISDIAVMRRSPSPRFRLIDRSASGHDAGTGKGARTFYSYEQGSEWGPEEYAAEVARAKRSLGIPVFVNIDCNSPETWESYTKTIAAAGPDGIEANISCPHGSVTFFGGEVEKTVCEVARQLVSLTKIPIVVKLSPQLTSPPTLASAFEKTGVAGLTVFNRLTGLDVDIETGEPVMHGSYAGHGGAWALNNTLRWVAGLSPGLKIPILASGGVVCAEDAVKCLMCGAAAVEICTIIYTDGFETIQLINSGIEQYLERTGRAGIGDIRGITCSRIKTIAQVERRSKLRAKIECAGAPPCRAACPIEQEAMGYIMLIRQRKYWQALRLIKRDNPFPSVCGRVCHHPCEKECAAGEIGEPLAIAALKRFVADMEPDIPRFPEDRPERRFPESVAVIGAGPAGLTAARDLARLGYGVEVFESAPKPGGMLNTIAPFRLPRNVVEREIQSILDIGVKVRTGFRIGRDATFEEIRAGHDAVLVAIGAQESRQLGIPGEGAEGVIPGLSLLRRIGQGERPALAGRAIVLGGGDVAMDCARSAIRLGADVTIFYRRDRDAMPAHGEQVADAEAEGVKLEFLASPVEIVATGGRVSGVRFIRNRLEISGDGSRPRPVPVEGSEFVAPCEAVIVAIGQDIDADFAGSASSDNDTEAQQSAMVQSVGAGLKPSPADTPGVFICGDAETGPASLVEAIAGGRRSAQAIHRWLRNLPIPQTDILPVADKTAILKNASKPAPCRHAEEVPVAERIKDFREITKTLSEEDAIREAERCLGCSVCAFCGECARICIYDGIERGGGLMIVNERCDGCGLCAELCPNRAISMEPSPGSDK
ncbi:MAG TPA: FAD-dependent oxidoreductase [Candidatus Brocadiia bacterium]|nr:FAD-dependent oxidoreductase [Candidatus Brocadiia bacterium]